jgi:hypothetical protein
MGVQEGIQTVSHLWEGPVFMVEVMVVQGVISEVVVAVGALIRVV